MNNNISRISKIRAELKGSEGKRVGITYARKNDIVYTMIGIVLNIRKSSIVIVVNNEMRISIGFRKIMDLEFKT